VLEKKLERYRPISMWLVSSVILPHTTILNLQGWVRNTVVYIPSQYRWEIN
jgi:hypothetical protein